MEDEKPAGRRVVAESEVSLRPLYKEAMGHERPDFV